MKYFKTYKDYLNEQVTNESSDLLNEKSDEQEAFSKLDNVDKPRLYTFKDIEKPDINVYKPIDPQDMEDIDKYIVFNPDTKHFVTIKAFNDYYKKIESGEIVEAIDKKKTVKKVTLPLKKVKAAINDIKSQVKAIETPGKKDANPDKKLTGPDLLNNLTSKKPAFERFKKDIDKISDPKISDADIEKIVRKLVADDLIRVNTIGVGEKKVYIVEDNVGIPRKALGTAKNDDKNHVISRIIQTIRDKKIPALLDNGKKCTSLTKKSTTADKVSESEANRLKVKPTEDLTIKKTPNDITIGKTKYSIQEKVTDKTAELMKKTFMSNGMSEKDALEEIRLVNKGIDKYNTFIKNPKQFFGSESSITITAWYDDKGKIIDQSTDAGKTQLKKSMLTALSNATKDANPVISKKVLELSKKSDKLNKEDFKKQLIDIFKDMVNEPDTRDGAPDIAEMITSLYKTNDGFEVFLPKASNFKLGDVIALKPIKDFNKIKSSDEMTECVSALYISMDLASVKFKEGGASASAAKIQSTIFTKEGKGVRADLYKIVDDMYPIIWSKDSNQSNFNKIENELKAMCKTYGLDFKKISTAKEKMIKGRSDTSTASYKKSMASANEKINKKNIINKKAGKKITPIISPKEINTWTDTLYGRWHAYIMSGIIMAKLYNKYTDTQNFGNVAFHPKEKKGVSESIEISETNGITSLCGLKFDSSSMSETGMPNNPYPTRMINMSRKEFMDKAKLDKVNDSTDYSRFNSYYDFLNEKYITTIYNKIKD
jgi:hypothetical protein